MLSLGCASTAAQLTGQLCLCTPVCLQVCQNNTFPWHPETPCQCHLLPKG